MEHCIATAVVLAELGLSEEIIAAGLLHDVLSDTRMTSCQLEEYMPSSVVALVEKVTRLSEISQLYRDNTHTLEAEKLLDMLTTMSDVGALLIKLADRLHNMRTVNALPRCKQVSLSFSMKGSAQLRCGSCGVRSSEYALIFLSSGIPYLQLAWEL